MTSQKRPREDDLDDDNERRVRFAADQAEHEQDDAAPPDHTAAHGRLHRLSHATEDEADDGRARYQHRGLRAGQIDNPDERDRGDGDDDDDDGEEDGDDEQAMKRYYLQEAHLLGQRESMAEGVSIGGTGVRFTPFNLDDEMAEGDYDEQGNYSVKKRDKDEENDAWADSVDWQGLAAKEQARKSKKGNQRNNKSEDDRNPVGDVLMNDDNDERDPLQVAAAKRQRKEAQKSKESSDEESAAESEDDEDAAARPSATQLLERLLQFLEPGETVAAALRRLGGKNSATAKKKHYSDKAKQAAVSQEAKASAAEQKGRMLELIETAHQLVASGYTNVYDDTIDTIQHQLQHGHAPDFGQSADGSEESKDAGQPAQEAVANPPAQAPPTLSDEVHWEYKMQNTPDADVHGPFANSQMMEWKDAGYFDSQPVFVRKYVAGGDNSAAYNSVARVDFDLYS
ncbi:hypothetical protein CAOG_009130 [Capsaspora owczarzaki ATCC 30864]|uniref:GYF domain-containing protein n=1 Tax=Capsaspora owczarzaki (strain ATCC 30864) TaxID=595528 RepID=A0A0D2W0J0_CAPO3|nr:hypothetical protein CAOG_009130 [Capsaspora owczarzaki ATCC 30864]